uniref:WD_REPEATS_REGION domain-containing protein n=1 Tax=Panagrellus redivivus TaxID=6233 RepID=A0A7E4V5N5_PANRE
MSDALPVEFRLASTFLAHNNDVKQVLATDVNMLLTCSRDESIKGWRNDGIYDPEGTKQLMSYTPSPPMAINSLEFVEYRGTQFIFGGRKDGSIVIYEGNNTVPFLILKGHNQNVCCLHVNRKYSFLVSGGWDHNAIIWSLDAIVAGNSTDYLKLVGHAHSVWAINSFDDQADSVLTGSADRTVKQWQGDQLVRTFSAHNDVVRSIVILNDGNFLTGCNDGKLRVYNREIEKPVHVVCTQPEEYIYGCSLLKSESLPLVAVAMETGVIEIYTFGSDLAPVFVTSVQIAASSAWSVAFMPNEDVAIAGSDGYVYIFTTNPTRAAPEAIMEEYSVRMANYIAERTEIQAKMLAQQEAPEVNIKVTLDDAGRALDLKYRKGTDPAIAAETFIRANGLPLSYLNEIVDYIKANVPEAARYDAVKHAKTHAESTREVVGNVVNGKKYDHIFDVKLDDGKMAKLTYNVGEDPQEAATRFVETYGLPISKIAQVANILRIQIPELVGFSPAGNVDPLTGGGSYSSAGSSANAGSGGSYADPLTGGGRYVPGSATQVVPNSCLPIDKQRPRGPLCPVNKFTVFADTPPAVAFDKLRTLNAAQDAPLSEEEISAIESIMRAPESEAIGTVIHYNSLEKALFNWEPVHLAPVVDALRLALLNAAFNAEYCDNRRHRIFERLVNILVSDPEIPVSVMILRAFANAANHPAGQALLQHDIPLISDLALKFLQHSNAKLQVAAAAVLTNIALILWTNTEIKKVAELGPREDAIRALIKAFEGGFTFDKMTEQSLILLLQAISTVMWGDQSVIRLAKNRNLMPFVNVIKDKVANDLGKSLARDIVEMLYAV